MTDYYTACQENQMILHLTNYLNFLHRLQDSYLSCNFYHIFYSSVPHKFQNL